MSAERGEELVILLGRVGEQYADPDDWRALIRAGRLRRVDSVAVRRPSGTTYQRADTVPELLALFEAEDAASTSAPRFNAEASPPRQPDPPALEAMPPLADRAPVSEISPPARPSGASVPLSAPELDASARGSPRATLPLGPAASRPATPPPTNVRRPETPAATARPRTRKRGCGLGGLLLFAILAVGAFQLTRWVASGDGLSLSPDDTVYATRETRVRPEPATGNTPLGLLERGDRLTGEWTTGEDGGRWLRITGDRYNGGFAWGANLDATAPPRLTETVDSDWRVRVAGALHRRPRDDAETLAQVEPGRRLRVAGRVDETWVEIVRSGGGVGYMRADRFEPVAADAGEETLSVEVIDTPPGR